MDCTQGALNKQAIDELKKQTDTLFTLASRQSSTLNDVSRKLDVVGTDLGWLKCELVTHISNSVDNIKQIANNKEASKTVSDSLKQCWTMIWLMVASVVGMAYMIIQETFIKK